MGFPAIGLATGAENAHEYAAARDASRKLKFVDVATGAWIVSWAWVDNAGRRRGDYEVLASYFLKQLQRR